MTTKNTKHSGFEAPVSGKTYPKNTKIRKNKDGTISLIKPVKK